MTLKTMQQWILYVRRANDGTVQIRAQTEYNNHMIDIEVQE